MPRMRAPRGASQTRSRLNSGRMLGVRSRLRCSGRQPNSRCASTQLDTAPGVVSVAGEGPLGERLVAIIGGETHRFRPLIDLYREAGEKAGHAPERLTVGLHSLGYVANNSKEAIDDYYPGYAETFTRIGKERGWPG